VADQESLANPPGSSEDVHGRLGAAGRLVQAVDDALTAAGLPIRELTVAAAADGVVSLFGVTESEPAKRRAWVFAVLYSVTGLNDPRHDNGLLAGYESRDGTWAVSGGRGGADRSMGFGLGGRSSSSGGTFDPAAQRAFAKHWSAVRECVVVRERP
jgi:hypothetical protein